MSNICTYLGNQQLIDLCQGSNQFALGAGIGVTLVAAYTMVKISAYAISKFHSIDEPPRTVTPIKDKVIRAMKFDMSAHTEDLELYKDLLKLFIDGKKLAQSEEGRKLFASTWKKLIKSCGEEFQERIIKEDMRGWALAKGLQGEDVAEYVQTRYEIEELRTKSSSFFRNLLPIADSSGKIIDPIDDEQVPAIFRRVIEGIEKSINK